MDVTERVRQVGLDQVLISYLKTQDQFADLTVDDSKVRITLSYIGDTLMSLNVYLDPEHYRAVFFKRQSPGQWIMNEGGGQYPLTPGQQACLEDIRLGR